MLKVALTGGIASGKSTVGEMFARRGAHVIRADEIAHELMKPGQPVYEEVVARFGPEILANDGTISRPKLAGMAFPSRIQELNAIVHPAVITYQDRWMQQMAEREPAGVAIVEAALIFEAHAETHFDKVVVVTIPFPQKVSRFAARMNIPVEEAQREVERRMAAQIPDDEKVRRADYAIDNRGEPSATERQVEKVWREMKMLAARTE